MSKKNKVETKLVLNGAEDYVRGLNQINVGIRETRKLPV